MSTISLLNIVYTNTMEESVTFYEALGLFRKVDGDIDHWWNEFTIGSASLALHWNQNQELPKASNPVMHLQVPAVQFEEAYANAAAHNPSEIQTQERIGRFFVLTDPSGVRVQVNEVN